ncbi:hypothetical protein MBLNU230_g6084t1 [Neophaeotheca triangularis]
MSISQEDFSAACEAFDAKCKRAPSLGGWKKVQLKSAVNEVASLSNLGTGVAVQQHRERSHKYLYIEKAIAIPAQSDAFTTSNQAPSLSSPSEPEHPELELTEHDPEALSPTPPSQTPTHTLLYEIHHHPTYQVPVLYLSINPPTPFPLVSSTLYSSQLMATGVMGAVTLTDHPLTGKPMWFVHPCRTQEAMAPVVGDHGPEGYLGLWFGVVGAAVGLSVPTEVARLGVSDG